jgi:hypothetical protein
MEFPVELKIRIEDSDDPIFDAPTEQDLPSLASVWDNGTRFGVYKLVEVRTLFTEVKVV